MVNVFQTAVFVPFVMQLKANFIAFLNSLQRNFQYTSLAQEAAALVLVGKCLLAHMYVCQEALMHLHHGTPVQVQ